MADREEHVPLGIWQRCQRFIEEQSCGEWGEAIEQQDAAKLARFVVAEIARSQSHTVDQDTQEVGREE